ncbi:MAG: NAD(P)-dependent oxidoreductase [Bacteroidota bacterium]
MTKKKKVLIVDDMHESILPLLRNEGFEPIYLPIVSREEILELIPDFHGLVIRSKTTVDKELIQQAKKLEFVARAGAGLDKLDEANLREHGILIVNAPEGNRDALGEHTLGLLLAVLHRINVSFQQIKGGSWDREGNRGIELKGKVVGIYGVGYMGKSFASKLKGLGCKVIGYDKYKYEFSEDFIEKVSLDEFQQRTEILSIHIPLTDETEYLFDKSYLSRFSQLRIVLNTARGKVLRTSDLTDLIEEGKVYGAGLDVLENEKPSTYSAKDRELIKRLAVLPNVIVTPHVGGWTFESYQRINEVLVGKLKAAFAS